MLESRGTNTSQLLRSPYASSMRVIGDLESRPVANGYIPTGRNFLDYVMSKADLRESQYIGLSPY
jgi:hypothetical protein